jgi:hypothetical protein
MERFAYQFSMPLELISSILKRRQKKGGTQQGVLSKSFFL